MYMKTKRRRNFYQVKQMHVFEHAGMEKQKALHVTLNPIQNGQVGKKEDKECHPGDKTKTHIFLGASAN